MALPPATIAPAFAVGFGPHIDRGRTLLWDTSAALPDRRPRYGAAGRPEPSAYPDLLIAAVAKRERVTVLHYDSNYDLIAAVTRQPMQWVTPPRDHP
jgi:predicted nucleic acid-binding protein